jgi:hypothetical protein
MILIWANQPVRYELVRVFFFTISMIKIVLTNKKKMTGA